MITLNRLRHAYPEPAGFCVDRKFGNEDYNLIHFFGSVKLVLNGEVFETSPGAVIIFNRGTPVYFKSETNLVHEWIHFDGSILPLLEANGLKFDTLYYPKNTAFITEITKELETEFYSSYKNRDTLLNLKFEELLIKLGRAVSGESVPEFDLETKEKFRYLRGKMLSCLDEKWTAEKMAKEVGFSQSRFFGIYKSIYGTTPTEDIINARINKAKNMLSFEKKSIEEIAETLGYENTTHFIRQFKGRTGLSPTAFRKGKKE